MDELEGCLWCVVYFAVYFVIGAIVMAWGLFLLNLIK